MKKTLFTIVLTLLCASSALAYTAYPTITTGITGLTSGSLIGYTVLSTNGSTVITARTTTGVVEVGGGVYVVSGGITVPDGTVYIIKWDRSDTSVVLGAAPTCYSSLDNDVKLVTKNIQFDGSNYVETHPETAVSIASGQNVATVGSQSPPTNWSSTQITSGGVVTANATQIGSQNVALDANNLLKTDLQDVYGSALTTAYVPANTQQLNGHAVSLDSNNDLYIDAAYWNASAISTTVPNTAAVTVGAYATHEDPGYLIGNRTADGSITYDGVLAAETASLFGTATNSFNGSTHTLTTTYLLQNNSTTAFTNSTVYGSNVNSVPVSSRSGSAGTLP